jgi:hypothetical protein
MSILIIGFAATGLIGLKRRWPNFLR